MAQAKFWVDFPPGEYDIGISQSYWFTLELSDEEYEELYQVWFDNDGGVLSSYLSNWDGHETLFDKINDAAIYALTKMMEEQTPGFGYIPDAVWVLSDETSNAF